MQSRVSLALLIALTVKALAQLLPALLDAMIRNNSSKTWAGG